MRYGINDFWDGLRKPIYQDLLLYEASVFSIIKKFCVQGLICYKPGSQNALFCSGPGVCADGSDRPTDRRVKQPRQMSECQNINKLKHFKSVGRSMRLCQSVKSATYENNPVFEENASKKVCKYQIKRSTTWLSHIF